MSLYLEQFGHTYDHADTVVLPDDLASQNVMPDTISPSMIKLPGGGVFNPWGDDEALPQGTILVARGGYSASGANIAAARAALLVKIKKLRGWNGKWAKLFISTTTTAYRWREARMWCDDQPVTPHSMGGFWQPMTLTFELGDTIWHGTHHDSDAFLIDGTPTATIINAGNGLVRDIVLTYACHVNGAEVGNVIIENTTADYICKIEYGGTIAVDTKLVIDCGAKTVKNHLTYDFTNFSIDTATHTKTEWFVLGPGNNAIEVTRDGGDNADTLDPVFDDAHK